MFRIVAAACEVLGKSKSYAPVNLYVGVRRIVTRCLGKPVVGNSVLQNDGIANLALS